MRCRTSLTLIADKTKLKIALYERSLKEKGEKPNVTTQGAFLMIGLALSLMVFPQMIQKFKERQILSTPVNKGFGGEIL